MSGWEVRPSNRARERLLRSLLIALLLALPCAFYLGAWWKAGALQSQVNEARALQTLLDTQVSELDELRQRLVVLGSGEQLAQQANEQSRLTIKLLEEQIFKQQQDLAFYKGVLAPDSRENGLRIRAFDLHPGERPGVFRYKLLLSRVGKDDKPLQGRLVVQVDGLQAGRAKSLSLLELSDDLPTVAGNRGISFAFKHLQAFPEGGRLGELQLPEGFEPQQVRIKAEVDGGKPVERQIKWID